MSNILIVGYKNAEEIRGKIDAIMKQNGWEKDSATVIWDAETKWCGNQHPAPYLVVRHSKAPQAEAIAEALHKELDLDIEIDVIHQYLASSTPIPN